MHYKNCKFSECYEFCECECADVIQELQFKICQQNVCARKFDAAFESVRGCSCNLICTRIYNTILYKILCVYVTLAQQNVYNCFDFHRTHEYINSPKVWMVWFLFVFPCLCGRWPIKNLKIVCLFLSQENRISVSSIGISIQFILFTSRFSFHFLFVTFISHQDFHSIRNGKKKLKSPHVYFNTQKKYCE